MLAVTKEELEKLIAEGKAANKDVTDLEEKLKKGGKLKFINKTSCGEKTTKGRYTYISTGPASPDDFKELK